MSGEQASIAQPTLSILRKMDTELDGVRLRLTMLERSSALKDEEGVLDPLSVVERRQRIERIERRLEFAP